MHSHIHTDLNSQSVVDTFTGNFKTQLIVVFFDLLVGGRGTYSFIANLVAKIDAADRPNSIKSSVLILIKTVCAICLLHTVCLLWQETSPEHQMNDNNNNSNSSVDLPGIDKLHNKVLDSNLAQWKRGK